MRYCHDRRVLSDEWSRRIAPGEYPEQPLGSHFSEDSQGFRQNVPAENTFEAMSETMTSRYRAVTSTVSQSNKQLYFKLNLPQQ